MLPGIHASQNKYTVNCEDEEASAIRLTDTDKSAVMMNFAEVEVYGRPQDGMTRIIWYYTYNMHPQLGFCGYLKNNLKIIPNI